jgi:hypothetical protein
MLRQMCASHLGFEAHKGPETRIRVPDLVWHVRRNIGLGCTPRSCEAFLRPFRPYFAIPQSVHHETVSL